MTRWQVLLEAKADPTIVDAQGLVPARHWELKQKDPGCLGYTLPETNSESTPENGWLEYDCFLLG